jgi:cytochrome c-type biogenesis protein CcmE
MNKILKKRLYYVSLLLIGLAVAASMMFYALRQNLNAFLTPSQLATQKIGAEHHFRLGGLVKKNSLQHDESGLNIDFIVTDLKRDEAVHYHGVLPDLFREGKGVIAEGYLNPQGIFIAQEVLAKHDENYTPRPFNATNEK